MAFISQLLEALKAAMQSFRAVATSEQAAQRSNVYAYELHTLVGTINLAGIAASEVATLEKWVACCRLAAIVAAVCCMASLLLCACSCLSFIPFGLLIALCLQAAGWWLPAGRPTLQHPRC